MKVLVADDDFVSRRRLQRTLEKLNYEVVSVADGLAAWNALRADPTISITVLDWMMPGLNGIDLVRRIRTHEFSQYIFALLLTSRTDREDIVHGMEAGADDYLTKPFDQNELVARLRAGERILQLEKSLAQKNRQLQKANRDLSEANYRMKRDLQAAAEIQKTLLPNDLPPIARINVKWLYKPCQELAGDILNIFKLDDRYFGLYLLDVSGHGVSAALLSVALSRILSPLNNESSILRKKTSATGYEIIAPAEVARRLNHRFALNIESGQFFTLVYGVLDVRTLAFTFISAGHPSLLLLKDGQVANFENNGLPIGIAQDAVYEEKTLNLENGDRLFIYSDGINEAVNSKGEQFGRQRLVKELLKCSTEPLGDGLDTIYAQITDWTDSKLHDDVSMLALEIAENDHPECC